MLVLTRKTNETIVIGGNIRVTMTSIRNRHVRLAIDAPPDVRIVREELVSERPEDPEEGRRASSLRRDGSQGASRPGTVRRYR